MKVRAKKKFYHFFNEDDVLEGSFVPSGYFKLRNNVAGDIEFSFDFWFEKIIDISYPDMVSQTKKKGESIMMSLTNHKVDIIHMGMAVAGEAGELLDAVKKMMAYNQELDIKNVIEELGDIEYYMEGLRQVLNLNRDDILKANQEKLMKRYKDFKYSDEQAKQRNDKQGIISQV